MALPAVLFLLTCISTFWAGTATEPSQYLLQSVSSGSLMPVRRIILEHYGDGLRYMLAVLGILLAHEMGHFLATVRYGVPASLPFFLPLPITPIGTVGAVIGIDGSEADRRQIFDIGIAGPLAGLLIAVPVMWYGATQLNLDQANGLGGLRMNLPLGAALMFEAAGASAAADQLWLGHLQGNPYLMAGWVGFLITGLNMLPVSQLDGGHVLYCLFGRAAHWIARTFMVTVILFILLDFQRNYVWGLMALLVMLMGTDHPPTRDDSQRLGVLRVALGLAALSIPILCLPLHPFEQ